MGVDLVKAVAVLVHGVADGVRALPESRVEDVDVLVDQRLLVALEERADLVDDLGDVGCQVHRSLLARWAVMKEKDPSLRL